MPCLPCTEGSEEGGLWKRACRRMSILGRVDVLFLCGATVQSPSASHAFPTPHLCSWPLWIIRDKSGLAASAFPWLAFLYQSLETEGRGEGRVGEFHRQGGMLGKRGAQLPWDGGLGVGCNYSSGTDKLAVRFVKS